MVLIFLLSLCIAMRRIRARRALVSNLSGAPPPRPMFMPWGAKNVRQHNTAPMTQSGAGIGRSGGTADVPPPAYGKESISVSVSLSSKVINSQNTWQQNDTFAPVRWIQIVSFLHRLMKIYSHQDLHLKHIPDKDITTRSLEDSNKITPFKFNIPRVNW